MSKNVHISSEKNKDGSYTGHSVSASGYCYSAKGKSRTEAISNAIYKSSQPIDDYTYTQKKSSVGDLVPLFLLMLFFTCIVGSPLKFLVWPIILICTIAGLLAFSCSDEKIKANIVGLMYFGLVSVNLMNWFV